MVRVKFDDVTNQCIGLSALSTLSAFKRWEITHTSLNFNVVCCMFVSGCERRTVSAKVVKMYGWGYV